MKSIISILLTLLMPLNATAQPVCERTSDFVIKYLINPNVKVRVFDQDEIKAVKQFVMVSNFNELVTLTRTNDYPTMIVALGRDGCLLGVKEMTTQSWSKVLDYLRGV
jgi:hypothetical protein